MHAEHPYYEHNILFRLLIGFGRFKLLRFVVILGAWYAVGYMICSRSGILVLPGDSAGFLEDIVLHAIFFMYMAMVGSILFLLRKLDSLLDQLADFIDVPQDDLAHVVDGIREFVGLQSRRAVAWYTYLLTLMFVLVCIFQVIIPIFAPQEIRSWALMPDVYPGVFCFAVVWALFQWVVVVGNVLWYALSIALTVFPVLYRYAKKDSLEIVPLAPDGKGGLAPIGDLSYALTLTISCGMLLLVSWLVLFGIDLQMVIGFPLYILALTALFFLPLQSVHLAMKRAKDLEIRRIAGLFRLDYSELPEVRDLQEVQKDEHRHQSLRDRIEYLADLDRLFRRVETMSVWPFNVTMLRQFFSLILVPMLLFMIQLTTKGSLTRMLGLINK